MDQLKVRFVLLLPLCLCFGSEVTLVKTIGSEPDVTQVCANETQNIITLIVCQIRTERSREECRLFYPHRHDFVHECDSRFTLMTENQTVFLHLTSLTPVDSGNYTCECSHPDGTEILYLNITVEASYEEAGISFGMLCTTAILGVTAFIIGTGVVLGCIRRKKHYRYNIRSGASVCEPSFSLDQDDPDDPYTSLQRPANDLYEAISPVRHQHDSERNSCSNNIATAHLYNQEISSSKTDSSSSVNYENV